MFWVELEVFSISEILIRLVENEKKTFQEVEFAYVQKNHWSHAKKGLTIYLMFYSEVP